MDLPPYFRHAIRIAHESKHPRYRLGAACIAARGRHLYSVGYNSYKTHPIMGGPQTLHAEIHAISRLPRGVLGSNIHLVIVRLLPNGYGLARPCPVCISIIEKVGIKRVIYTTGDGYCEERL